MSESPEKFIEILQRDNTQLYNKLHDHIIEFGWLNMHGYRFNPMNLKNIVERIKVLIESDRIVDLPGDTKNIDLERILHGSPDKNTREMIDLLQQLIALRFYRINVHLKAYNISRPFFNTLANNFGIHPDNLIFCTEDEIVKGLKDHLIPKVEVLNRRRTQWFSIHLQHNTIEIKTSTESKVPKIVNPFIILFGVTASVGKVLGKTKVIKSSDENDKVQKGDILVTSTSIQ